MKNATELGFNRRSADESYLVTGNHKPGQKIEYTGINDGDSVSLRYKGERITIEEVRKVEEGSYQGTIEGFEPSISMHFEELTLRDEITFNEDHVFTCSRQR